MILKLLNNLPGRLSSVAVREDMESGSCSSGLSIIHPLYASTSGLTIDWPMFIKVYV